jgi:hypothetical protein
MYSIQTGLFADKASVSKPEGKRPLEYLGVDGRILLKPS